MWLSRRSELWTYLQKSVAETYATRSLTRGLTYPFDPARDHGLSLWRVGAEAVGVGAAGAAVGYGLHRFGGSTDPDPAVGGAGRK
jgi:hypothetical protein